MAIGNETETKPEAVERIQRRAPKGATFEITLRRQPGLASVGVVVDGEALPDNRITNIETGRTYRVVASVTVRG